MGEIKSVLTATTLDSAIEAGRAFKRLRPTFENGDTVSRHQSGLLEATGGVPPFFVLAFEQDVSWRTLLAKLNEAEPVPVPAGKEFLIPDATNRSRQSTLSAC